MTSQRNNRLQQRRQSLREQQRRELKALTDFEKSLEAETAARLATARLVSRAVDDFGQARAAEIFDLTPKEVAAYVKEAADAEETSEPTDHASQSRRPAATNGGAGSASSPAAETAVPAQSAGESADALA